MLRAAMRVFGRLLAYFPVVAVGALLGCDPDPVAVEEILPYEGDAYPDRVEPFASEDTSFALITNSYSDSVSALDLASGKLLATRPVGRNPVDLDGPHHIAVDPVRNFAYIGLSYPLVAAQGPHATHGSASASGYVQKLNLLDLSVVGQVRVEASPGDVLLSEDGKRLVASHFDLVRATKNPTDLAKARSSIAVLDPSTIGEEGAAASFVSTCVAAHGMAMTQPGGSPLYVTCYGEDKVAIIDLDNAETPIEYVEVGPGVTGFGSPTYGPYAALMLPDKQTLVISSTVSKDVRFMDIPTKTMLSDRTILALGAPFFPAVSADGSKLVIPTQQPDALLVVDLAGVEETITRSFTDEECVLPHVVDVYGDGYAVVCEGNKKTKGNVLMLDADLEVVSNTEVGVYPDGIVQVKRGAK